MIPTMYHASHLMKYKGFHNKITPRKCKGATFRYGIYVYHKVHIHKTKSEKKWFTKIRLDILYYSGCFDQKLLFSTGMLAKLSL